MELIVRSADGRERVVSTTLSVSDVLEDDSLAKLADGIWFAIEELTEPAEWSTDELLRSAG